MLLPGADLTLTIEKPAAGGRMIARHQGQVILVSGVIPGELVRARVERVGRGVVYARAREILSADADRRPALGDWTCGGNVYSHIAYERQRLIKGQVLADALLRIGRIPVETPIGVAASPEQGYRMRARLHVEGTRIGFYREGTHELCDPAPTGQLLADTIAALRTLGAALDTAEPTGVTSIELAENVGGTDRVVHIEAERPIDASRLARLKGPQTTGVAWSSGRSPMAVAGSSRLGDDVEFHAEGHRNPVRLRLTRDVRAFFQANRYLLAHLVERVVALAGAPGEVADLYAGVGLFGVALASAGYGPVTAIEGNRISAADLRANAAPCGDAVRPVHTSVEEYLRRTAGAAPPACLIVDPPRTGMTREAVEGIVARGARRIVYVSCDVATLARDTRRLVDAGYELRQIEAFDLFPNTAHLEGLIVLDKPERLPTA
jgi:tRNA/tmRNA/rRNA uracil-C5-methylase (TrmA/RlmC/RlmD family)